jgi:hypothetical protein
MHDGVISDDGEVGDNRFFFHLGPRADDRTADLGARTNDRAVKENRFTPSPITLDSISAPSPSSTVGPGAAAYRRLAAR